MPKIDQSQVPGRSGSGYPKPYDAEAVGRTVFPLGATSGLTQFGANRVRLDPGAWSSQRHWHENQDEFLVVTQGPCTLVDDQGETELATGDCASFPANDPNGHHVINKTDHPVEFVVIGTHTDTEIAHYSDIDMKVTVSEGQFDFTRKDGSPI